MALLDHFRPPLGSTVIEAWPRELTVGESLPTLPLWLEEDLAVPVELDETYRATCAVLRI